MYGVVCHLEHTHSIWSACLCYGAYNNDNDNNSFKIFWPSKCWLERIESGFLSKDFVASFCALVSYLGNNKRKTINMSSSEIERKLFNSYRFVFHQCFRHHTHTHCNFWVIWAIKIESHLWIGHMSDNKWTNLMEHKTHYNGFYTNDWIDMISFNGLWLILLL